jgi:hypothetical protein
MVNCSIFSHLFVSAGFGLSIGVSHCFTLHALIRRLARGQGCSPIVMSPGAYTVQSRYFKTFNEAQESIPRNQIRQPMLPGGPLRQPYSYSVLSCHGLFKNSSTENFFFNNILAVKGCWPPVLGIF